MLQKFRDQFNHNLCKLQYWQKRLVSGVDDLPKPPSIKPKTKQQVQKILSDWKRKGSPIPPPYEYKQAEIRKYAKKYKLDALIETGTYLGATPIQLQKDFKKIHTIELDRALYCQAEKHLKSLKNIKVWQGNSASVLARILGKEKKPCLFWLDAHFSGGATARDIFSDTPIIKELDVVLSRNMKDVLLIDDARSFDGKGDYPTIPKLKSYILKKRPKSKFSVDTDIIRVVLAGK